MSIMLELSPETETRLIAQANAQGISVQQLLQNTIELLFATSKLEMPSQSDPNDTETWIQAFRDWANSHSTSISDEAVSRESIYRDREDAQR